MEPVPKMSFDVTFGPMNKQNTRLLQKSLRLTFAFTVLQHSALINIASKMM